MVMGSSQDDETILFRFLNIVSEQSLQLKSRILIYIMHLTFPYTIHTKEFIVNAGEVFSQTGQNQQQVTAHRLNPNLIRRV